MQKLRRGVSKSSNYKPITLINTKHSTAEIRIDPMQINLDDLQEIHGQGPVHNTR